MTSYAITNFYKDIRSGSVGEQIFIDDFLSFLKIRYENVTGKQGFQAIDTDFVALSGYYEIKTNYKDDHKIIVEEYTNINTALSPLSYGWFYKSRADSLVFISKDTRTMILIPFTDEFKKHYGAIKENYDLIRNKISIHNGNKWQSAFRKIPLESINGYFAYYRKPGGDHGK